MHPERVWRGPIAVHGDVSPYPIAARLESLIARKPRHVDVGVGIASSGLISQVQLIGDYPYHPATGSDD
jgi:hypothetical protein